jgi:uncharacterized protein YggE
MWWIVMGLASAQTAMDVPTLDVTGVGEVRATPDEAVLSLGVRAQADRADTAFDDASARMQQVFAAITPLLSEERIRTTSLSLEPRYDYEADGAPRLVGYEAASMLELRVDDPEAVGSILDAAVAAGADDVAGVRWVIEETSSLAQEALAAAVADARGAAEQVATDLGVTLGDPIRVHIRDQRAPTPTLMLDRAAMDAEGGMPVNPGEQAWRAEVDVTFALTTQEPGT